MSYCINSPCSFCTKKDTCTDVGEIQKAVTEIHNKTFEEGHKGAGSISLLCVRQESVNR